MSPCLVELHTEDSADEASDTCQEGSTMNRATFIHASNTDVAMSPLQGFGQMWQKTFRIRLKGAQVKPAEVITTWKERFPTFWPKWDLF